MSNASIAQASAQPLAPEKAAFIAALRSALAAADAPAAAQLLREASAAGGRDGALYHIAAADLLAGHASQRRERLDHLRAAYAGAAGWQRELEAAWAAAGVPDARAVVAVQHAVAFDPTDISRAEVAVAEADRAHCLPLLAEAWTHLLMLDRSQALRCALELELRLEESDAAAIEATYESALRLSMQQERLQLWLTRRWERELGAPSPASIEAGVELIGMHAADGAVDHAASIARLLWHQTGIDSAATSEALDALERSAPKALPTLLLLRQRAELLERWDEAVDRIEEEAGATDAPGAAAQLHLHAASIAITQAGAPGRALAPIRRAIALDPGVRARAAAILDEAIQGASGPLRDELLADRRSLAGSLGDWATLHRLSLEKLPNVAAPEARAALLLELGEMEQRGLASPQVAMARFVEAAGLATEPTTRQQAVEQLYRMLERPEVQEQAALQLIGLLTGSEQLRPRVAMRQFLADRVASPEARLSQLIEIARELDAASDAGAEAAWQICIEAAPALDEAWERTRALALARGDGPRAFALLDAQIAVTADVPKAIGLARLRLEKAAAWSGDQRAAWGATAALFLLSPDAAEIPQSLGKLSETPDAIEMLTLLANHLVASGHEVLLDRWTRLAVEALGWNRAEALTFALPLLDRNPSDAELAAKVETAVLAHGNPAQKRLWLERIAAANPADAEATLALVEHLVADDQAAEAQALLQAAAERQPTSEPLWRALVDRTRAAGNTVAEVVALEGLIEVPTLAPADRFGALIALARHYDRALGRPDLAAARASSAARIRPTDGEAIDLLRDHAAKFGAFGPLEEALATATALADGDPDGSLGLERLQIALRRGATEAPALARTLLAKPGLGSDVAATVKAIAATLATSDDSLTFEEAWSAVSATAASLTAADWQRLGDRLPQAADAATAGAFASAWLASGEPLSEAARDTAFAALLTAGSATIETWAEIVAQKLDGTTGPAVAAKLEALSPSASQGETLLAALAETPLSFDTTEDIDALSGLFRWFLSLGATPAAVAAAAAKLLEPAGPAAGRLAAALFDLLSEGDRATIGLSLLEAALPIEGVDAAPIWGRIEALARAAADTALLLRSLRGQRTASAKRSERTRISRELARIFAEQLGDTSGAADALAEALQEEPLHLTLLEDHAAMLERAERWEDALRAIERFASAAPVQELQDELAFRAALILGERLQRAEAAMALLLPMAQNGAMSPTQRAKAVDLATGTGRWEALSAILDAAATRAASDSERQALHIERATRLQEAEQFELAWTAALDAAALGLSEAVVARLLPLSARVAGSAAAASSLSALASAAGNAEAGWPLWERAASLLAATSPSGAFALLKPAVTVPDFASKAEALQKQIATEHGLWSLLADHLAAAGGDSIEALLERATVERDQLGDATRALATACNILKQAPLHAEAWAIVERSAVSPADWLAVDGALAAARAGDAATELLEKRIALARGPRNDRAAAFALAAELSELAPDRCDWLSLEADARAADQIAVWLPRAEAALLASDAAAERLAALADEATALGLDALALRLHRGAADRSPDAASSWLAVAATTEASEGPEAAAAILEAVARNATDANAQARLSEQAAALREAALPAEIKAARAALSATLATIDAAAAVSPDAATKATLLSLRASWLLAHADVAGAASALEEAMRLDPASRIAHQVTGDLALAQADPAKAVTHYLAARVNQDPAADHPLLSAAPLPGDDRAEPNATVRYALRAARALEAVGAEDEAFETFMNGHLEDEDAEGPLLGLARISLLRGNRDAAASYLAAIKRRSDAIGEIPSGNFLALAAKLEADA